MARIKATVKGNLNFLVDVKRTTAEVLARTVDMLGERTATRARSGAPRGATRELAGSITYRGKPQRDGYAGEIRIGVDYSPFVLFGTKSKGLSSPHHPLARDYMRETGYVHRPGPGKLPPLDSISAWCRAKGIPEEAVFPIALQISRVGIAANDFFFPHVATARRDLVPEGIKALRRALRRQ